MGLLAAQSFIKRAAQTLGDSDNLNWPETELLEYLSDAQRAAVLIRPEVNPVTAPFQLVAGTKQTLPADGFVLLDVTRNLGDGSEQGASITVSSKDALDRGDPSWHSHLASAYDNEIINYLYDLKNRKTFFVYPQGAPEINVEIVYSKIPAEIVDAAATIEVDDVYQPALLAYMFYRAHMKDMKGRPPDVAKAAGYFNQFQVFLLGREESDVRIVREDKESPEVKM